MYKAPQFTRNIFCKFFHQFRLNLSKIRTRTGTNNVFIDVTLKLYSSFDKIIQTSKKLTLNVLPIDHQKMNNSIEMRDNSHSREPILVDFSDNVSISSKNSGYKIMKPFHIFIITIKKCKILKGKTPRQDLAKNIEIINHFNLYRPNYLFPYNVKHNYSNNWNRHWIQFEIL